MSCPVLASAVVTRSAIRVTESVRTGLERRSILPGSPIMTATSKRASTTGRPQRGRATRLCGNRSVRTITATTATAMGQRASPMTDGGTAANTPPAGSRSPGAD